MGQRSVLGKTERRDTDGRPTFVHRLPLISRKALGNEDGTVEADMGLDVNPTIRKFAAPMKAVPVAPSSLQGFIDTVALTDVTTGIAASLHDHVGACKGIKICHSCGDERLSLQGLRGSVVLISDRGGDKLDELPLKEWSHRASEACMDPTLVTIIESVAGARQQIFPRVTKAGRAA